MEVGIRDAKLGRISFVTIIDDTDESLGDEMTAVGAGVVPGERRPRTISLSIPLRGDAGDDDPFATGFRMRRQVRALMENGPARFQGLYFNFSMDPEQNGWLMVGTGDVKGQEGSLVLSEWTLDLGSVYRVGKLRTHRPARLVQLYDRRLITVPRDILGTIFSTDWSGLTPFVLVALPVGATDILGVNRRLVVPGQRVGLAGAVPIVTGSIDGEVLTFEQGEQFMHLFDDVVIWDRMGKGDALDSTQAIIYGQDPVGFWRLGDAPGATVLLDSSGNGLNGTYAGQAAAQGLPGALEDPNTAAGFTGSSYGRIADVAGSPLRFVSDFTVMGWIQPVAGAVDLILNGDIENEVWPWTATASAAGQPAMTLARDNAWASSGSYSLHYKVTRQDVARVPVTVTQPFQNQPVKPNQQYTLQFDAHVIRNEAPNGNLFPNPSGENGVLAVKNFAASTAGQPAASVVDTTAWSKYGTHASRYTFTTTDIQNQWAGSDVSQNGMPVTPGHYYAGRVSFHIASISAGQVFAMGPRFVWYKADGSISAVWASDTGLTPGPRNAGDTYDGFVIAKAPSDAAFVALQGVITSPQSMTSTIVVDLDGFMVVDLGATFSGPTDASTNASDVPAYFDTMVGTPIAPTGLAASINWYKSDGTPSSVRASDIGTIRPGAGDFTLSVTAVSPSDAAFAAPVIYNTLGGWGTPQVLDAYFDNIGMVPGPTVPAKGRRYRYDVVGSKWQSANGMRAYRFAYDYHLQELRVEMSVDGTAAVVARMPAVVADDIWAHLAVAYIAAAGALSFYRNGVALGTIVGMPTSVFAAPVPLVIGKWEAT